MKIHGKKLQANMEVVVIPRQSGDLVFKAQAVLNFDDHDKVNPQPEAPVKLLPGGIKSQDVENPRYREKLDKWAAQKFYWMLLKSLSATEGLEWETVDISNPATWENYRQEMEASGLSPGEIARIELCVTDACGLNQAKIDEATERFLAGQAVTAASVSSQSSEQPTTASGEPVNAGA